MVQKKMIEYQEFGKVLIYLIFIYLSNIFIKSNNLNETIITMCNRFFSPSIGGSILNETYTAYLIFSMRIGYLLLFIYLIKTLYSKSKNYNLYKGIIYFSFGIFFENIGSILYFENLRKFIYILGIGTYMIGSLKILIFFIDKTVKNGKKKALIELILIVLSSIFLAFSNLDIQILKDLLNIYLYVIVLFLILVNSFLVFKINDFLERKEALTFLILFGIEAIIYIPLFKYVQLNNFDIISLIILNLLIVDLKQNEYLNKTNIENGININYIRILIIFLLISSVSQTIKITGILSVVLIILIMVELLFFIFTIESDYNMKMFNLLLNKAKLIETREKVVLFLEEELIKKFRFVDVEIIVYSIGEKVRNDEKKYVSFNPKYKNNKYTLEVSMMESKKEIGKIYIKDSCMILNKNKLKRFLSLVKMLTPILDNLILKEAQFEYYKINKKEISDKLDELEKENYYLKEIIRLKNKKVIIK